MRILFFGSRKWWDEAPILEALQELDPADDEIIHGDAEGADEIAGYLGKRLGFVVHPYRAEWRALGKRAGPLRNQRMLDSGIDRAYGFRLVGKSDGTDDMRYRLEQAGVPFEMRG